MLASGVGTTANSPGEARDVWADAWPGVGEMLSVATG